MASTIQITELCVFPVDVPRKIGAKSFRVHQRNIVVISYDPQGLKFSTYCRGHTIIFKNYLLADFLCTAQYPGLVRHILFMPSSLYYNFFFMLNLCQQR